MYWEERPTVYNIFVITDIRLLHEEAFVKSFPNHFIIRVDRNVTNTVFNKHISETAIDSLNPCCIIENNGTLDNLYKKIEFITKIQKLHKLGLCKIY